MIIKIRKAKSKDMPILANIFLEARRDAFHWQNICKFTLNDFYDQTNGEIIFIAENDQKTILGFISIWRIDSFIHHLFVLPQYQKKGVGTLLMNSLSSWLPLPWRLKCMIQNTHALSFYKKKGWVELDKGVSDDGEYVLLELAY